MKIYLRAFKLTDLELIYKWRNNEKIQKLLRGNKYFVSYEMEKKWIEQKINENKYEVYCSICLKNNDQIIGYISLNNIDYKNRKCNWGGMIIGDENARNNGHATNAAFLMLKYGFEELNLNKISGYWLEENKASIIIAKMMGFKQEGILIQDIYKNNKFNNTIVMSLFKEGFQNLKKNFIR